MDTLSITSAPLANEEKALDLYLQQYPKLCQEEKWKEITTLGKQALTAIDAQTQETQQKEMGAKILAQMTSSYYYLGKYQKALNSAVKCRHWLEGSTKISLTARSLYLESAAQRALAALEPSAEEKQRGYQKACDLTAQAWQRLLAEKANKPFLAGKIHFNWGAALADNPLGNLSQAKRHYQESLCYFEEAYQNAKGTQEEIARVEIRLGNLFLKENHIQEAKNCVKKAMARPISHERTTVQALYLRAKILQETKKTAKAIFAAQQGLEMSQKLSAQADMKRFSALLADLDSTQAQ